MNELDAISIGIEHVEQANLAVELEHGADLDLVSPQPVALGLHVVDVHGRHAAVLLRLPLGERDLHLAPLQLRPAVVLVVVRLGEAQLAAERVEVVARTRQGKLSQEELEGGTFTISNLGMYGVEQFVAVLNPPQAAILAVGAIEERPVAENGEVAVKPMMSLTLTCDHRAIDGATAADFLRELKTLLEEPGLAL